MRWNRTAAANEGGETDAFSFSLDSQSASEKKLNLVTNSVRLKSVLKLLSVLTLAGWFMRFAHDPSSTVLPIMLKRMSVSTFLGVLLAFIGYKKKSLDFSGAIFASLVGVRDHLFRRSIRFDVSVFLLQWVRGDESAR